MLLLSFALADRINILSREKDVAARDAIETKQAMFDAMRRHELETRVIERTHALEKANLQLREKEGELEHMARHDPLTGLANRALLDERLAQVVARARRNERSAAVLMLDLDGFKEVNDAHGHAVGDQLLIEVARRLTQAVRAADTLARLGGDEFVIVMEDLRDAEEAELVAQKLVSEMGRPFRLELHTVEISASVGVARFPSDAPDPEHLLRRADQAMYAAKSAGRHCWRSAARD